jgi:hypothetical protein
MFKIESNNFLITTQYVRQHPEKTLLQRCFRQSLLWHCTYKYASKSSQERFVYLPRNVKISRFTQNNSESKATGYVQFRQLKISHYWRKRSVIDTTPSPKKRKLAHGLKKLFPFWYKCLLRILIFILNFPLTFKKVKYMKLLVNTIPTVTPISRVCFRSLNRVMRVMYFTLTHSTQVLSFKI